MRDSAEHIPSSSSIGSELDDPSVAHCSSQGLQVDGVFVIMRRSLRNVSLQTTAVPREPTYAEAGCLNPAGPRCLWAGKGYNCTPRRRSAHTAHRKVGLRCSTAAAVADVFPSRQHLRASVYTVRRSNTAVVESVTSGRPCEAYDSLSSFYLGGPSIVLSMPAHLAHLALRCAMFFRLRYAVDASSPPCPRSNLQVRARSLLSGVPSAGSNQGPMAGTSEGAYTLPSRSPFLLRSRFSMFECFSSTVYDTIQYNTSSTIAGAG